MQQQGQLLAIRHSILEASGGTTSVYLLKANPFSFRYALNLAAGTCVLLGGFMNIVVWYHAKNLKIFDDEKAKSLEDITLKDLGSTLQLQKLDENI